MEQKLFHNKYRVNSPRLHNWDYSQEAKYFITINTLKKGNILGEINNKNLILNRIGNTANDYINEIPMHFPSVIIHAYIIMPDHVHILLEINKLLIRETRLSVSLQAGSEGIASRHGGTHPMKNKSVKTCYSTSHKPPAIQKASVSVIINQYKGAVKRYCNQSHLVFKWKPKFYDRIIRNDEEFNNTVTYIKNNPKDHIRNHPCDT